MPVDILIPNKNIVRHADRLWWAANGLIHSEHAITGDYKTHTVRDVLYRLAALQEMVKNSRHNLQYQSTLIEIQSFIENMIPVCRKAQDQGRPEIASHARQRAEEDRVKRLIMTNPDPLPVFGANVPKVYDSAGLPDVSKKEVTEP